MRLGTPLHRYEGLREKNYESLGYSVSYCLINPNIIVFLRILLYVLLKITHTFCQLAYLICPRAEAREEGLHM